MGGGWGERDSARDQMFLQFICNKHIFLNASCNCTGCGVHPGPDNYSLFIVLYVHCSELHCSNIFCFNCTLLCYVVLHIGVRVDLSVAILGQEGYTTYWIVQFYPFQRQQFRNVAAPGASCFFLTLAPNI